MAKPAERPAPLQPTVTPIPAEATAAQIPVPQPMATFIEPQPAMAKAPAIILASPASTKSSEDHASTVTQMATATAKPVEYTISMQVAVDTKTAENAKPMHYTVVSTTLEAPMAQPQATGIAGNSTSMQAMATPEQPRATAAQIPVLQPMATFIEPQLAMAKAPAIILASPAFLEPSAATVTPMATTTAKPVEYTVPMQVAVNTKPAEDAKPTHFTFVSTTMEAPTPRLQTIGIADYAISIQVMAKSEKPQVVVMQNTAPQLEAKTIIAKPQSFILQNTSRTLEPLESLENPEPLAEQAPAVTLQFAEAAAAHISAPQPQATATIAKPQFAIPQEPLENLEPLTSQSSTVVPQETASAVSFMPTAKPAESSVPLQATIAEATAAQIPAPQTQPTATITKPQPAIPQAPARNRETLEPPENLSPLKPIAHQNLTTVALKETTAAMPLMATEKPTEAAKPLLFTPTAKPVETSAPLQATTTTTPAKPTMVQTSVPQPKDTAITAEPQPSMAEAPSRNESVASQASTVVPKPAEYPVSQMSAPQPKAIRIAKPQPSAAHISSKHLESPESAISMAAPSVPQDIISHEPTLDMPAITPTTITKLALTPSEILTSALNELTSAIMVNIDDAGHMNEIRLVLKPDVLDGTTILLKCDQTQVSVTFFPGVESAEQLLLANQGRIVETLAAIGHLPIQVSIINSEGRRQIRKSA